MTTMGGKQSTTKRSRPRNNLDHGNGQIFGGFHGDSSRGNAFWEYPNNRSLVTRRWDTHDATSFCTNARYVRRAGGGVQEWVCNGHHLDGDSELTDAEMESKLEQLRSMGFDNRTLGAELLRDKSA